MALKAPVINDVTDLGYHASEKLWVGLSRDTNFTSGSLVQALLELCDLSGVQWRRGSNLCVHDARLLVNELCIHVGNQR